MVHRGTSRKEDRAVVLLISGRTVSDRVNAQFYFRLFCRVPALVFGFASFFEDRENTFNKFVQLIVVD